MKHLYAIVLALGIVACGPGELSYEKMTPEQRMQKITEIMSDTGWTVLDIGRIAKQCVNEKAEVQELCAAEKGDPIAQWIIAGR